MGGGAVEVTAEFAERARLAGACSVPPVGTPVERLKFDQLCWAEDHAIVRDDEMVALRQPELLVSGRLPLWAFSGYGSGSGYGHGYGDGHAYGDGYGSGDGDGSGYGDGSTL